MILLGLSRALALSYTHTYKYLLLSTTSHQPSKNCLLRRYAWIPSGMSVIVMSKNLTLCFECPDTYTFCENRSGLFEFCVSVNLGSFIIAGIYAWWCRTEARWTSHYLRLLMIPDFDSQFRRRVLDDWRNSGTVESQYAYSVRSIEARRTVFISKNRR